MAYVPSCALVAMLLEEIPTPRSWAASWMTRSDWLVSQRIFGVMPASSKIRSRLYRSAEAGEGMMMGESLNSITERLFLEASGLRRDTITE